MKMSNFASGLLTCVMGLMAPSGRKTEPSDGELRAARDLELRRRSHAERLINANVMKVSRQILRQQSRRSVKMPLGMRAKEWAEILKAAKRAEKAA